MTHIAGHIGTATDTSTSVNRLAIGQLVELPDGRQARVAALPNEQTRDNPNATVVLELLDPNLAPFQRKITMPGGTVVTPLGQLIGFTRTGEITDTRDIPFDRFFGTGTSGGSAPAFSSSKAAQDQAEAFRANQERLSREFQANQDRISLEARAEENRLAEEAALKRGRLSTLTDLIQSFVGAQSQARDTLANLQPDPFRFAAVAGGIPPFGTTPQQGFQTQLQDFASAPIPTTDPNASLPSIESAIQGLTGANVPLSPQVFGASGLAGGGTVPAPFDVMSARLVGEGGPEVMVTGPQGVTILPLSKGAQEGGFFPFQPIEFDESTLFPALTTSGIFSQFAGGQIPRVASRPDQSIQGLSRVLRQPLFEQLGVRPQFVSGVGRDEIFFVDPTTGQRRLVGPGAVGGIQPGAVAQVEGLGQFGSLGASAIGRDELTRSLATVPESPPSPFTRFSAPIVEPTTGTLLPAPFTVARQMNQLRLTNPTAFNLLLSAYSAAGVPATAVLSSIQASLPFGQARTNIGLN